MSCHSSQSSNRVIRWPLGLGLLAASACSTAQVVVDLVFHNGFEACWSKAITKAQFLDLMKSTVDATTACMPELLYFDSGVSYDVCNTAACPNNQTGCPVALNAGTFSGDFGTGAFSAPGSTGDVSIHVSYDDGVTPGICTITFTTITQTYHPTFFIQPDGNSGDYMAYLLTDPLPVTWDTYDTSAPGMCGTLLVATGLTLIQIAEGVASTELTTAFDGNVVGESVCPLTP